MQIGKQVRRILGKGDEVRGKNVRVIPGADGLALLLHLHLADVRNLSFDGLDGPALIHGLNMQGDGQLCVQFQNLPQELVRQFRCHDLQIAGCTPIPAHPERPRLGEMEALKGGDGLLGSQTGFYDVFPAKVKGMALGTGMGLAVEHRQPFLTVQRLRLHAQPLEIAQDVRLHPFQPGPGCGKVIRRDAEGEILGAVNAVVAFGDLPPEHIGKLRPDAVKGVMGGRDVDLIPPARVGTAVDEGELKRDRCVKIVEKRAPAVEDGRLIFCGRHGIVDVLIGHGFGKQTVRELAYAVRQHPHIRDGLLGREGTPVPFSSDGSALLAFCLLQQAPPFSP